MTIASRYRSNEKEFVVCTSAAKRSFQNYVMDKLTTTNRKKW